MKRRIVPIAIGLFITIIMLWFQLSSIAAVSRFKERFDHILYDRALSINQGKYKRSEAKIVIVDVDEESIKKIGRWPWPRKNMIDLVERLRNDGALVIAFDMVFSEPDTNPVDVLAKLGSTSKQIDDNTINALSKFRPLVPTDADFAQALSQGDFVLGYIIHDTRLGPSVGVLPDSLFTLDKNARYDFDTFEGYFANIPELQAAAKYGGFLTALPDNDGVIRRAPLVLLVGDKLYPSLALEAARLYLLSDKVEIKWAEVNGFNQIDYIHLGEHEILTDAYGEFLIPFHGPPGNFTTIPAADLLSGNFKKGAVENALVFIGSSALGFGDTHATPTSPSFPGAEIQATIADGIIEGKSLYNPSWSEGLEMALIILFGLALAFLLPFFEIRGILISGFTSVFLIAALYFYLFSQQGIVISPTGSLLLIFLSATFNLGYGLAVEGGRRRQLKSLFGQYVPKEHVELMSEHPEQYSGEGQEATLTVLFADIVGFTSLSEKLDARNLKSLLNRYFTPMTRVIFENHGTVDKYVGDMIMAFWGAPIHDQNHAHNALASALQMRAEVQRLKAEFMKDGLPEIEIGIGLNTGEMFVGDMGSEYRRAYTVLGDTVNVASRLEGLTRFYGVHIAVSEATKQGQEDFAFRPLDRVRVKGRKLPLEIFEVVSKKSELTDEKRKEIADHEEALWAYYAQDWKLAKTRFESLKQQYPDSKLYALFLARIEELAKQSLPADWDGSFEWVIK